MGARLTLWRGCGGKHWSRTACSRHAIRSWPWQQHVQLSRPWQQAQRGEAPGRAPAARGTLPPSCRTGCPAESRRASPRSGQSSAPRPSSPPWLQARKRWRRRRRRQRQGGCRAEEACWCGDRSAGIPASAVIVKLATSPGLTTVGTSSTSDTLNTVGPVEQSVQAAAPGSATAASSSAAAASRLARCLHGGVGGWRAAEEGQVEAAAAARHHPPPHQPVGRAPHLPDHCCTHLVAYLPACAVSFAGLQSLEARSARLRHSTARNSTARGSVGVVCNCKNQVRRINKNAV